MVLTGAPAPPPAPVDVRSGRGRSSELTGLVGRTPTLAVIGGGSLARLPPPLRATVASWSVVVVTPGSGRAAVDRVLVAVDALGPGTVVGLGGGMVMDVAKVAAALAGLPRANADTALNAQTLAPGHRRTVALVLVPTTAGSGSEVTPWATLWEPEGKSSFEHGSCFADVALVDPELTDSLPPALTLAGGLDAMAHAVESIWGRCRNEDSDRLALEALELIGTHLERVVTDPDPDGRDALAQAATAAGRALAGCRSAGAHALSYDLTHRYGVPHGLAVGALVPALFPGVQSSEPDRMEAALHALHIDDARALEYFVDRLFDLAELPQLRELRLDRDDIARIIATAEASGRLANHPTPIDVDRLGRVLGVDLAQDGASAWSEGGWSGLIS